MGTSGIVNIEREAKLSGSTHDKGVLILSGYLRQMYAQDKPLTLSASLCFEQSYGGIDGDSASSTELYALLSRLANLPLRQDLAVTGSVNQWGEVQAIGGVNEKIEGFFDVCVQHGLTGQQGVLIPQANVRNLMLRHDVVEAIRAGRFHVYPITHIDQGLALLTGVPAGDTTTAGHRALPGQCPPAAASAGHCRLWPRRTRWRQTAADCGDDGRGSIRRGSCHPSMRVHR